MAASIPNDQVPPDCGRRLQPAVIDARARDQPDKPWASLPLDDYDLSKGFEDISYATLASAIDKMAWFIERNIGKSSTFETVAYLGVSDIRYHIIEMAVCKTGHKVLFSSLLNSSKVHVSLMQQTDCTILLSANGVLVHDILNERPSLKHVVIPELHDLLDTTTDRPCHYPYKKTFEQAKYEPYLILHTSGTTGTPKPVIINHALTASLDAQRLLPDVNGRKHYNQLSTHGDCVRTLIPTSPFHVVSATWGFAISIFGGSVMLPGFRHRGASPSDICPLLDHANVTRAILTPWIMEDIARRSDAQHYIERFDNVMYGTAVLSSYAADTWSKWTSIQNVWGMTETLGPAQLEQDPDDHAYITLDMEHSGIVFRDTRTTEYIDGRHAPLYELVWTLTPGATKYGGVGTAPHHARMSVPLGAAGKQGTPEYPTGDLWTPHPDPAKESYVWRFAGRSDDLITFSTGINVHPGPLERALTSNELVRAALVTGNMHQQPLALVVSSTTSFTTLKYLTI